MEKRREQIAGQVERRQCAASAERILVRALSRVFCAGVLREVGAEFEMPDVEGTVERMVSMGHIEVVT